MGTPPRDAHLSDFPAELPPKGLRQPIVLLLPLLLHSTRLLYSVCVSLSLSYWRHPEVLFF